MRLDKPRVPPLPEAEWDPHYIVRGLLDDDVPLAFDNDAEPGPPVEVKSARAEASEFGIAFSAIEVLSGRHVRTSTISWTAVRADTDCGCMPPEDEGDKSHPCPCRDESYDYAPCPYDLAIEGEEIECNCCLNCRERCAENI